MAEDYEEGRSLLRGGPGNKKKSKIIGSCGMPPNDPRNRTTMPPILRTTRNLHTGERVELGPGQFNRTLLIYVGTVGLMLYQCMNRPSIFKRPVGSFIVQR